MEFPFAFSLFGMLHMFNRPFYNSFVNCLFMTFGHLPAVFLVCFQFFKMLCGF